jgi:hypothetical protein
MARSQQQDKRDVASVVDQAQVWPKSKSDPALPGRQRARRFFRMPAPELNHQKEGANDAQ